MSGSWSTPASSAPVGIGGAPSQAIARASSASSDPRGLARGRGGLPGARRLLGRLLLLQQRDVAGAEPCGREPGHRVGQRRLRAHQRLRQRARRVRGRTRSARRAAARPGRATSRPARARCRLARPSGRCRGGAASRAAGPPAGGCAGWIRCGCRRRWDWGWRRPTRRAAARLGHARRGRGDDAARVPRALERLRQGDRVGRRLERRATVQQNHRRAAFALTRRAPGRAGRSRDTAGSCTAGVRRAKASEGHHGPGACGIPEDHDPGGLRIGLSALRDPDPVDLRPRFVNLPEDQLGRLNIDDRERMPVGHQPIHIGDVPVFGTDPA